MLIRAIALSLAILLGIGAVIPFITESAEAGPKWHKKKKKKLKKYSKAWWAWRRKEIRKKRAILARKRALKARQILLARKKKLKAANASQSAAPKSVDSRERIADTSAPKETSARGKAQSRAGKQSPAAADNNGEFRVSDENGSAIGSASVSVFGAATAEDDNARSKTVGGVPTSSLRRSVINRMINEEGWVVNDYQKEINGKKVYVVVAQSSVRGAVQSRLFYFTEIEGKIYSLAANSPNEAEQQLARESEKMIQSLQRGARPTQAGLR